MVSFLIQHLFLFLRLLLESWVIDLSQVNMIVPRFTLLVLGNRLISSYKILRKDCITSQQKEPSLLLSYCFFVPTVVLQMTFKGSPLIYYGDEIGMTGETDPFCRKPFPWENEKKWNSELFELYKTLTTIRSGSEALKKGNINFIYHKAGVLGFEREYEGETILVFTNSRSKDFDVELELDGVYENVFSGERINSIGVVEGKGFLILKILSRN